MSKIALVGMGLVGRAWAISFARAGHDVLIWDEKPGAADEALRFADEILPDLAANGLLRRLPLRPFARACAGPRHSRKRSTARATSRRARPRTSASNGMSSPASTRSRRPARCSRARLRRSCRRASPRRCRAAARCSVVHPINPPYLIPAVEVVPAPWTDAAVVERTAALMRSAGHAPIVMKREIDGFVMNRLQGALLEEAFRLVAEGYASVEDVDIGIRDGLALRWSFMGPFETIDLNAPGGVRDYAKRYQRDLRADLPVVAMAGGLVRAGDGRDRGGSAQASAGGSAGRTPGVARPAADGARRA